MKQNNSTIVLFEGTVPFNTGEPKENLLHLNRQSSLANTAGMARAVFGRKLAEDTSAMDSYSFRNGTSQENYSACMNDVPTLTPYIAKGSDTAVIVVPGGAFLYKEMEREGHHKARELNKRGVTAFVLDYRVAPYQAPAFLGDLQRAVRYVRSHASEYGVDPHKIGTLGFSAGGYIVGAEALLMEDTQPTADGYVADEIDTVSGRPDFVGMVYPVTGFYKNPNMLALVAGDEFFDEEKRPGMQAEYSLQNHLSPDQPPVFFVRGTIDPLRDMIDFEKAMKQAGAPFRKMVFRGASHGLYPRVDAEKRWMNAFVKWINDQR